MKSEVRNNLKNISSLIILLVLVAINVFFTPNFMQMNTLMNIITQITPIVLCGMGMTLVISTGDIDVSVAGMMALSGIIFANLVQDRGLFLAISVALIVSVILGSISGYIISKLDLQAMVITLGANLAVRGLAQVISNGRDLYLNQLGEVGQKISDFGIYRIGGVVPVQVVPIAISVFVTWLIARKLLIGRHIQAVGDSPRSGELVGINAVGVTVFVFAYSSFLAAISGMFQVARVSVASGSSLGQGAELDAIAAVVIGGTPMSGGTPRVFGTLIGAIILQLLNTTCVMNNIPFAYAQVFKALMLVVAVYIQDNES